MYSPTTSPWPPFHGEAATEKSVVAEGQLAKPQWCFAVITM